MRLFLLLPLGKAEFSVSDSPTVTCVEMKPAGIQPISSKTGVKSKARKRTVHQMSGDEDEAPKHLTGKQVSEQILELCSNYEMGRGARSTVTYLESKRAEREGLLFMWEVRILIVAETAVYDALCLLLLLIVQSTSMVISFNKLF